MKKLLVFCCAAGVSFGLSGAAYSCSEEERHVNAMFEQAQLAIAKDKSDALVSLSVTGMLNEHEDKVRALLDCALRVKNGQHTNDYIEVLTDQLKSNSEKSAIGKAKPKYHHSGTLTPLDVAIIKGQVEGVRMILERNSPNMRISRLTGDGKVVSVNRAVAKLIKARKDNKTMSNGITATLEQLLDIQKLIDGHNKANSMSPLKKLKHKFTKK